MRSSGSKRSLRVAFVVLLVLAALAVAAPAALAYGSINGWVYSNADSVYLQNIDVYAFDADELAAQGVDYTDVPNLADAVGSDRTEFGYYEIQNLPGGPIANPTEYRLWFQDMSPFNHYVAQWYAGSSPYDAAQGAWSSVAVVDNEPTYAADEGLYPACTISGNVGAAGIEVYVWTPEMGTFKSFAENVMTGNAVPDAVTDAAGDYMVEELNPTGGAAGPTSYGVLFYDPSGYYAPEWWGNGQAPWYSPDPLTQTIGAEGMSASVEALALAGTIAGAVDGDVGDDTQYDLAGIEVTVYAAYGQDWMYMGEDVTDDLGRFSVGGLPVGTYFVRFTDPTGDYFDKWFNPSPYYWDYAGDATGNPWIDGASIVEIDDPGYQDNGVYALMKPIPRITFVHPPFGVNDGPDRFETEVGFVGWGLHFVSFVDIWKPGTPPFSLTRLDFWSDSTFAATGVYNLAQPLAPTGTYNVSARYYDYYAQEWTWGYLYQGFQVVSSWVPTVPATPPSPTVPVLPAEPTPIVTPQPPAPQPPAEPVAGPVSVSAEKASVKKGAVATLRFQVSESVLGGSADVKVVIATKAGKVVKQVKKSVSMNEAASVSFRCKLAKGSYTYTVSAGAASASSTLVVK